MDFIDFKKPVLICRRTFLNSNNKESPSSEDRKSNIRLFYKLLVERFFNLGTRKHSFYYYDHYVSFLV